MAYLLREDGTRLIRESAAFYRRESPSGPSGGMSAITAFQIGAFQFTGFQEGRNALALACIDDLAPSITMLESAYSVSVSNEVPCV